VNGRRRRVSTSRTVAGFRLNWSWGSGRQRGI